MYSDLMQGEREIESLIGKKKKKKTITT